MATWQRRRKGEVVVQFYDREAKKIRQLPRLETHLLDGQPDHVLDLWVKNWEEKRGAQKPKHAPLTDETLSTRVEAFLEYQRITRKKNNATLLRYRHSLEAHVIPFFLLGEPPLRDPNQWPAKSVRMLEHLTASHVSQTEILKANTALRLFWDWLSDEGFVLGGTQIRVRRPVIEQQQTPLSFAVTPEQVLAFAAKENAEIGLMALVGFFFSLRTQEVFALKRSSFVAGSSARMLECCRVMAKNTLFDRLAVNVTAQRGGHCRASSVPKGNSKGWVACFSKAAAERIVTLLKTFDPAAALFTNSPEAHMRRWERATTGTPLAGITLKDLRRASIYWLGHNTSLGVIELRSHARHKKTETTELYLRRPEETVEGLDDLDLEA